MKTWTALSVKGGSCLLVLTVSAAFAAAGSSPGEETRRATEETRSDAIASECTDSGP